MTTETMPEEHSHGSAVDNPGMLQNTYSLPQEQSHGYTADNPGKLQNTHSLPQEQSHSSAADNPGNTHSLPQEQSHSSAADNPGNTHSLPQKQPHGSAANNPWVMEDRRYYQPLYKAALNGDWERASRFFETDPGALTAVISDYLMTAAHVAASAGKSEFVKNLVQRVPKEALERRDVIGQTALHHAAISGSIKAVRALVKKNPALTQIMNDKGRTPLLACCRTYGSREMVWYLCSVTRDEPPASPFTGHAGASLIYYITSTGLYDISLHLLQRYPQYATIRDENILRDLAKRPSAFRSGSKLGFWKSFIYQVVPAELNYAPPSLRGGDIENLLSSRVLTEVPSSLQPGSYLRQVLQWSNRLIWKTIECVAPGIRQVMETKLMHKFAAELVKQVCRSVSEMSYPENIKLLLALNVLPIATRFGTVEVVKECLQFFPDLFFHLVNGKSIIQLAIENRREGIYNLMRETTARNKFAASLAFNHDNYARQLNLTLHLAAKLPPPSQLKLVSGSALQMQREVQWFKDVENFVPPISRELRNDHDKTPWEVFMDEHKDLAKEGEKWMKDSSNSCMVVATLIATVVFAAAFTVPGGNNDDKGFPTFSLNLNSFMVFVVSDALALFSSSTSLLMFLSILTARYTEEDFLEALPKRLIIGLGSLFFAVATMMIAFSATLWIVLGEGLKWASVPITLAVSFPVTLFMLLQLPLFIEMVWSTYGNGIFRQQSLMTV